MAHHLISLTLLALATLPGADLDSFCECSNSRRELQNVQFIAATRSPEVTGNVSDLDSEGLVKEQREDDLSYVVNTRVNESIAFDLGCSHEFFTSLAGASFAGAFQLGIVRLRI